MTSDALLVSSCLNASVGWNYGPCSENLNPPINTRVEVECEIAELPAMTDFPILWLNRWVSHLCQAVLNLFIEFFSVAVAAWGFTLISFHNCARIPVSPTRFSIPSSSRCREQGRPRGILHPFCSRTDIQLWSSKALKPSQWQRCRRRFHLISNVVFCHHVASLHLLNHNLFPVCSWVVLFS